MEVWDGVVRCHTLTDGGPVESRRTVGRGHSTEMEAEIDPLTKWRHTDCQSVNPYTHTIMTPLRGWRLWRSVRLVDAWEMALCVCESIRVLMVVEWRGACV